VFKNSVLLAFALTSCVQVPLPPLTGPVMGYTARTWRDPVSGGPMKAVIFFPPMRPLVQEYAKLGPWWVEAASSSAIAFGRHPVVFISHGTAGSRFGHHDLAVELARAGYVVCAIEHPGDNYGDQSRVGTERVLLGRAWQLSAAIDALFAEPMFVDHLDERRIGVAGFSAGAYTSLLLVGAKPDFSLWAGYCSRHPDDAVFCRSTPPVLTLGDKPTFDARVRAAYLMAPVGVFFGERSLAPVRAPVALAVAEKDSVLLPAENAEVVRAGLSTVFEFTQIAGADHYVFLAPCNGEAKLCADPPGVDRRAVHRQLDAAAVKFFQTHLR
jgi:predicted dienelactone hydrolase